MNIVNNRRAGNTRPFKKNIINIFLFSFLLITFFVMPAHAANSIFLGDSRTVGMYNSIYSDGNASFISKTDENGDLWYAKSGEGIAWMRNAALSSIEREIANGTNIYILLGINDVLEPNKINEYAKILNQYSQSWIAKGATVTFVSLNPVREPNKWDIKNSLVEYWNNTLKSKFSSNIRFLDTYSQIKATAQIVDWGHYTNDTYRSLYNILKADNIAESSRKAENYYIVEILNEMDLYDDFNEQLLESDIF